MMDNLIQEIILSIITSGAVYFMFQKWITNKFSKDLEEHKAKYLHEFSDLMNQKISWRDKEISVLSECWSNLASIKIPLGTLLMDFRTVPDFSRKSEEEISQYIQNSDFNSQEKEYFLSEHDKDKAYYRIISFRDVNAVIKQHQNFRNYLEKTRIFIRPDIKEQFDEADKKLKSIIHRKQRCIADKKIDSDLYTDFDTEVEPLIGQIEKNIQEILYPSKK